MGAPLPEHGENPWKLALEGSDSGVWYWNLLTGEQTHSRRWEEMLGYAPGELDQNPQEFSSRVHPQDIAAVSAAVTDCLEGRNPGFGMELRLLCKDGSWKWVLSNGIVVSRDGRGRPLHMIGTHTDLTAHKQAQAALLDLNAQLVEKTALLQTTLNSISQGIFMIDAQERVTTYNPRVCEMLDLPASLLADRATLQELTLYQLQRGDFGPHGERVDANARNYVTAGRNYAAAGAIPTHYLRETPAGRTLEIATQSLPAGGMVRTFTDVTDYVQAESARKQLNQLLDIMQSMARVGGLEVDVVNDRLFWTAGTYRILETSPAEFTPTTQASARRFYAPESLALIRSIYSDRKTRAKSHDIEIEMITAKGRRIWVHAMGAAVWEAGRLIKRTGVIQDISERKQAEALTRENEQRWKLALEGAGDGMWDWNIQTGEEFFSKNLLAMYGFGEGEIGNHVREFDAHTHPDDMAQVFRDRQAHFDGLTPSYTNEHRVRCKDGSWKWVLSRGTLISRDAQGRPLRMIGTHTDITSRKAAEVQIWQQAHFDPLTELPNRRMLRDRLAQEIRQSRRDGQQFALLFIDLDHFKEVNDTLGHDRGDLLLVEAARRLRGSVRECDTVARMGGDEFTIILTQIADTASLESILHKLLQAMQRVFQLEDEQVFVTASIGVTLYPVDGGEVEDLFKNADQALYIAKGAGRNRFSFFTPALQAAAQTRVRLAHDLRSGLTEAQFWLAYQPIVELANGAVHKAEALIRWQHPTRGLISPADFIPIAESSGLIVDIGEWVFQQAAHQVQAWRSRLDPRFQISVNRSPVQFHQTAKPTKPWFEQLRSMGLQGNSMVVEITEGLLLDSSDSVAEQLLELQDAGIGVSLDDFGTGYSSLSYLQKFNIDFIKIDQSFVRHLIPASTDLALCKAIILMAHELGMKVIAEGVETAQQRDLLAAAGCDYGQGYLFAKPMPAREFEAFMAARQTCPP
jgi:diguanylate cyclase (GGDEF)-like protein/PAS domain S-box-containing protein